MIIKWYKKKWQHLPLEMKNEVKYWLLNTYPLVLKNYISAKYKVVSVQFLWKEKHYKIWEFHKKEMIVDWYINKDQALNMFDIFSKSEKPKPKKISLKKKLIKKRQQTLDWQKNNKEKYFDYQKKYRQANSKVLKEKSKIWYHKNKSQIKFNRILLKKILKELKNK